MSAHVFDSKMDKKIIVSYCFILFFSLTIGSINGFFFLHPHQFIGSHDPRENEINNHTLNLKSILPHRIQAGLSKNGEIPAQGSEENGGIGIFARKLLKGVQSSVSQIMKAGSSLLNREQSGRSLDMEDEFIEQTSANDSFQDRVATIFPGTLWCGGGNKARSDDELGRFRQTDNCCRDHDMCPQNIPAGEERYGLKNSGLFTRSHCNCDRAFYECLKEAGSLISKKIGFTYFTILGPQCFSYEYPVTGCEKRNVKKCVRYSMDDTQDRQWQWFDNDLFLV